MSSLNKYFDFEICDFGTLGPLNLGTLGPWDPWTLGLLDLFPLPISSPYSPPLVWFAMRVEVDS